MLDDFDERAQQSFGEEDEADNGTESNGFGCSKERKGTDASVHIG